MYQALIGEKGMMELYWSYDGCTGEVDVGSVIERRLRSPASGSKLGVDCNRLRSPPPTSGSLGKY